MTAPAWLVSTATRVAAAVPWALGLAVVASACDTTGTFAVTLKTAPQSDVLEPVTRARLSLSDPPAVVESVRDPDGGFTLALDVPAEQMTGELTFEGFDAADTLVAFGRSGALPIAAINFAVSIYVASPLSIAEAPVRLEPPRTAMGVAPVSFGAVLAWGHSGDGDIGCQIDVYSIYLHDFAQSAAADEQTCADAMEGRSAPAVAATDRDLVYLFGGRDSNNAASDALYRFDPNLTSIGIVPLVTEGDNLARAGATMVPIGGNALVVTGDPLVRINGFLGPAEVFPDAPSLVGPAVTSIVDGVPYTLFAGAGNGPANAVLLTGDGFVDLALSDEVQAQLARTGHTIVALASGAILVVGGGIAAANSDLVSTAVRVDPAAGEATVVAMLATPRRDAAVAATADYVVVAGGTDADGNVIGDAEVFDARSATLEPVATLPLVIPRTRATAVALSNGQILFADGVGDNDQPIGVIELFTSAP